MLNPSEKSTFKENPISFKGAEISSINANDIGTSLNNTNRHNDSPDIFLGLDNKIKIQLRNDQTTKEKKDQPKTKLHENQNKETKLGTNIKNIKISSPIGTRFISHPSNASPQINNLISSPTNNTNSNKIGDKFSGNLINSPKVIVKQIVTDAESPEISKNPKTKGSEKLFRNINSNNGENRTPVNKIEAEKSPVFNNTKKIKEEEEIVLEANNLQKNLGVNNPKSPIANSKASEIQQYFKTRIENEIPVSSKHFKKNVIKLDAEPLEENNENNENDRKEPSNDLLASDEKGQVVTTTPQNHNEKLNILNQVNKNAKNDAKLSPKASISKNKPETSPKLTQEKNELSPLLENEKSKNLKNDKIIKSPSQKGNNLNDNTAIINKSPDKKDNGSKPRLLENIEDINTINKNTQQRKKIDIELIPHEKESIGNLDDLSDLLCVEDLNKNMMSQFKDKNFKSFMIESLAISPRSIPGLNAITKTEKAEKPKKIECAFKSEKIFDDKYVEELVSGLNNFDKRNMLWEINRQRKLILGEQKKQKEEISGCTFEPQFFTKKERHNLSPTDFYRMHVYYKEDAMSHATKNYANHMKEILGDGSYKNKSNKMKLINQTTAIYFEKKPLIQQENSKKPNSVEIDKRKKIRVDKYPKRNAINLDLFVKPSRSSHHMFLEGEKNFEMIGNTSTRFKKFHQKTQIIINRINNGNSKE